MGKRIVTPLLCLALPGTFEVETLFPENLPEMAD